MKKKNNPTTLSLNGTNILKAIAILAVFLIHISSSIAPSPFVNESPYQLIAVAIDQFSRISVPLFVALSGYGLYWKYSEQEMKFGSFFARRISKVLPQYIFWSLVFVGSFYLLPSWAPSKEQPNFLWQLLLGRADYHLYFVPMIFQIYLLFPIILKFFKKWPLATLLGAIFIQLVWWWFFSYQGLTVTSWKYFAEDGEQYLWMTNWIAYFVLGMYLPNIWQWFDKYKLLLISSFTAWIVSGVYIVLDAQQSIQSGIDPLFALKFTRYPLFIYSSLAVVVVSYLVARLKKLNSALVKLGAISYTLYLSHTLFLRIGVWLVNKFL
jgi:probable poly-beta-1,6-N-acetyl-D-glucosamine export protein